jgi:acyl carrier protein
MSKETEIRLRTIIVEHLGVDEAKVIPSAAFIEDFGADSLEYVELLMAAEEEFECEITDDEAEKVITMQDAIDLIGRKTK